MQYDIPFTQFVQSTPLFTLGELRQRYRKKPHSRSILNMLHRLRQQGRVRQLTKGVYRGALAAVSLNRFRVPAALRNDAAVALHSALEWHGVANQVFQTVYYFSARARKDVVFDNVTYRRAALPVALARARKERFQTLKTSEGFLVTNRERSLADCLLFLDYSGGVEELDQSLAMFPSFDFDAALEYLKLLGKPWLYSRLGFLLDRHADKLFFRDAARDQFLRHLPSGVAYLGNKGPGSRWVPAWKVMVPETLAPFVEGRIQT